MFGKAKKEVSPEFIQVRSYYGMAIHIKQGEAEADHPALCGYDNWLPTNSVIPVTSEQLIASIPQQHGGWFWCTGCASALTGLPTDSFAVTRK